jgi:ABC-type amino acid transport substrate-binding protein
LTGESAHGASRWASTFRQTDARCAIDPRTADQARTTKRLARRALALLAALALGACTAAAPESSADRLRIATEAIGGVHLSAAVIDRSLAATEAIADFAIDQDVRSVLVRIVDDLDLKLTVAAPTSITLADAPKVCLVGPYSAPDDAGLSDRCWGDPDLGALLAAQLPTDSSGHPQIPARQPIAVNAALERGDVRCDYPPGEWTLEVGLEPFVDGISAGRIDLPPVTFEVPWQTSQPIPLRLFGTRYCGLANSVYRDQGEPDVVTP